MVPGDTGGPHGEAVGPWLAGEQCRSSLSLPPLSPRGWGCQAEPVLADNGPVEGHIWGGESLSITGSRMGPALQRDAAECPNLQTAPTHGKWFAA